MLNLVLLVVFLISSQVYGDVSDVGLTPDQMIANHGYPSEVHQVTTEDGYIITVYRIPHGINDKTPKETKPAVLIMHGFTSSASEFVALGPEYALSYILADASYDVWVSNARGTQPSRNHTTIDVNTVPEKFFNFTWHEIGIYDVANTIDYILDLKGDDSLYYVGHSQGTTAFLVFASMKPEYNEKIRLASLMAPAAIVENYPNEYIRVIASYVDQIWPLLQKYKFFEVPVIDYLRERTVKNCRDYPESYNDSLCDLMYSSFAGHVDKHFMPIILSNEPSNAGLKQYVHFGQLVKNGGFHLFDYGKEGNLEIYGTETPPPYDLSKISAPIAVYYASNDAQIAVEDEAKLVSMLPNVVLNYLVPDENFGHSDFGNSEEAKDLVYPQLISEMSKH